MAEWKAELCQNSARCKYLNHIRGLSLVKHLRWYPGPEKLFPKSTKEEWISVRDDGLGDSMQTTHLHGETGSQIRCRKLCW
ncbi:unnamed protein product [Trifolium pratense]|uniref:Uncharacterized protein n=1 Tax=Trifolium pratense TaxID=57577 RepID=A0ACB0J3Q2_TRIPR|nr:unnamed protein product [Trifolium pratense]